VCTPSLGCGRVDEPVQDCPGVLAGLIVLFGVRDVDRVLRHGAQRGQRCRLDPRGWEAAGLDGAGEQGSANTLGGFTDEVPMQFLCEELDLAGQVGVGLELQFLGLIVVVCLGLLEGGLAVLADHDERREEDRFE
jgi:hypothetical protein